MEYAQKRKLAGAAIIVMSAAVLSRIIGFVRTTLIMNVHYLNTSDKDALFMSFTITDLMNMLLVGGAIASVLIPVLSGYMARNEEEDGWKAVSTFINLTTIMITVLSILGVIFAPQLIHAIAPGFDKETAALTVKISRIMFPSVAFMMLVGLINGILNSYHRFAVSSYGPLLYNVCCVMSVLFLSKYGVTRIALGIMFSAILYFLFQLTFVLKNLKYYRLGIYLKHPGFRKLLVLAVPSLIASSIAQINILISQSYNSNFKTGSVTALKNANDIWQLPYGIFALGMGIAILPSLSEMLATKNLEAFKNTVLKSLKTVLMVIIPSSVAIAVLGIPVTSAIYKWSATMDADKVILTSRILTFFTIALISQSVVAIVNRAFYANNNTKTPLYVGLVSVALNTVFCFVLYKTTNLGASGMALGYSLSSVLYAIVLLGILDKRMQGMHLDKLTIYLIKVVMASLAMGAVLMLVNKYVPVDFTRKFTMHSKVIELVYLVGEAVIGTAIYVGISILLKVDEVVYMLNMVSRRMKSLMGKGSKVELK
ncbi:MAG: murein biosynthesis integral membrane protein MurJ [Bacillota bacterium]|nr:murein biosynthesis integral membrane protein MurJ [Bacillota bacterium]